jgi:hypothetical protein
MSNSVSFIQPAPGAEVGAGHSAATAHGVLADVILDMAAIMNRARGNIVDAQAHLNNFRKTEAWDEFGVFIGDWGRLNFDVFAELLPGVQIVYRTLGAHTLDDRRQTLVAILNQVRAAKEIGEARARAHVPEIRAFVGEIADGARDPEVRRLEREINGCLAHLEGPHANEGQRRSLPVASFTGLPGGSNSNDQNASATLARTMLADAQKLAQERKDEQQKRDWEDSREADYQYVHMQDVKRNWDKTAVQTREATQA